MIEEKKKFKNGEWCNLQKLVLNYKSEEERIKRLDELDSVNYNGAGIKWFDTTRNSLNDDGVGIKVEVSCWSIKKVK